MDVFYPAPILSSGIVLIDTPGVGSTFRHQTDAAHEVLPECDLGFFVLSVDPPVTEAELSYLDRVRPAVGRLFFVLNKIDYLTQTERSAGDRIPTAGIANICRPRSKSRSLSFRPAKAFRPSKAAMRKL